MKEQDKILSTKKFILVTSGNNGQNLFQTSASTIEQDQNIKAVLIYCDQIKTNVMWASQFKKTNHVYTLNATLEDLAYSVEFVRRK